MLPKEIEERLPALFNPLFGEELLLRSVNMLHGGSINSSLLLKTNVGDFFIKYNLAGKHPGMFESEAKGLELLENTFTLKTPKVLFADRSENYTFLVLEYIQAGQPNDRFWRAFARNLAMLHKNTATQPGLDFSNYIGSLLQDNRACETWSGFFINRRLLPLLKQATDMGYADVELSNAFDRLFVRLAHIFPEVAPSLLHGDLWGGNFISDTFAEAYVVDPAVYYGNREMDIAMSKLFGGFSGVFYDAYNEYFPLETGWGERVDICNLYPMMVHLILFGQSYLPSVRRILNKF